MCPKILVIRGGAIGDFVLTLPAIKLLRDNFPAVHLEILGYPHIVSLAAGRYYADAIRSIEYSAMAGFFVPNSELAPDLAEYFSSFQQVISYLYDPDGFFEANLRRAGVKNLLCAHPLVGPGSHAARQLAQPLEQLALFLEEPVAEIFPSETDRQFAAEFLGPINRPVVAIHPGSGSARKNWPIERWQELAGKLLGQKPQPLLLLVGGEADEGPVRKLKAHLAGEHPDSAGSLRLALNLPLPHLAALLQRASLFLGHDSGVSHIAAAVKTPSILLFGPTDPEVWAPQGAHVRVVAASNGDLSTIATKDLEAGIANTCGAGWIF
jgi:heptosyltransferase-2